MALQVTQETEHLMLRQITGQTAQQALPLTITNQAAAEMEPQTKVDSTKAVEEAKELPTDKLNEKADKGNDAASSSRY